MFKKEEITVHVNKMNINMKDIELSMTLITYNAQMIESYYTMLESFLIRRFPIMYCLCVCVCALVCVCSCVCAVAGMCVNFKEKKKKVIFFCLS